MCFQYSCGVKMAESQGVETFPLPPMQYAGLYTDENVAKGKAPKPPLAVPVCQFLTRWEY